MASCVLLRVLPARSPAAVHGVLGCYHATAAGVHSTSRRGNVLYRVVWLGDDYCPDAKRFDRVGRQITRVVRTEDSDAADVYHSCYGSRACRFHPLAKSPVRSNSRSAEFRTEVAACHSGIALAIPAATSRSKILLKPETRFYQNLYYPKFVASLVWNDRSLRIYVAGQHQLTQQEIASMNYVISFNEFSAHLVRSVESDRS